MTTILLTAFFVYGLHATIWSYLEFLERDGWIVNRFHKMPKITQLFLKPLFFCNVCMSSVWGTIFYVVMVNNFIALDWIVTIISCAGLVSFANTLSRD